MLLEEDNSEYPVPELANLS